MNFLRTWWQFLAWREVFVIGRQNVVRRGDDGIIMTQLTILGLFGWHLRIHFFYRGDGELFHSHPRGFISVCLLGAYREQLYSSGERLVTPGTITVRKATDAHNVTPLRFPCVTLALTTPIIRKWEKFSPEELK